MKSKKTLIILIVVFALLIGGATVLYNRLSQDAMPDQLVGLPTQPSTPATQPSAPATQPSAPATQPSVPATQPSAPATQPSVPATQPTSPATQPTEPTTQPSQPTVPDFVVYDAAGNPVRLSDYFGKPIVLNFWASWCGPCKAEMPHFQEMYEKWGDEVAFLMVNVTGYGNDTKAAATKLINDGGYTFPVFFDMTLDAASVYGISAFPTTFFINANGDLVTYAISSLSAEALQRGIDMIR